MGLVGTTQIGGVYGLYGIIVRMLEICRESHVSKNSKYSSAKIMIYLMKLSVYVIRCFQNKFPQYQLQSCSNLGTGIFPIYCRVTWQILNTRTQSVHNSWPLSEM